MRKRFKLKKRACALCKPFKMGWQKRFKNKELQELKEFEVYVREWKNGEIVSQNF